MSLQEWSKSRLDRWEHVESYICERGIVEKSSTGEWVGKVYVRDRVYRLSEAYVSAAAAMGAVERTWEREKNHAGGKG